MVVPHGRSGWFVSPGSQGLTRNLRGKTLCPSMRLATATHWFCEAAAVSGSRGRLLRLDSVGATATRAAGAVGDKFLGTSLDDAAERSHRSPRRIPTSRKCHRCPRPYSTVVWDWRRRSLGELTIVDAQKKKQKNSSVSSAPFSSKTHRLAVSISKTANRAVSLMEVGCSNCSKDRGRGTACVRRRCFGE